MSIFSYFLTPSWRKISPGETFDAPSATEGAAPGKAWNKRRTAQMPRLWVMGLPLFLIAVIAGLFLVPNTVGTQMLALAKAKGLLAYTPEEATELAYSRCTTCHGADKVLQYCSRCGPPFVVVAHSMKKFVELANLKIEIVKPFSDAELIAITQVWNALVGNWEGDWRQQDIKKLLRGDEALIGLAETPLEERPIEWALKDKTAPGSYKEIQSFGRVTQ